MHYIIYLKHHILNSSFQLSFNIRFISFSFPFLNQLSIIIFLTQIFVFHFIIIPKNFLLNQINFLYHTYIYGRIRLKHFSLKIFIIKRKIKIIL